MIFVLVINLYATRLLLKYLGVENFGLYNVVGSIVIFVSFLRQALTNATSRYLTYSIGKQEKNRLKKVYSMAINSHLILAFILTILLEIIGVYFLNNQLKIPQERISAANWIFQFSIITFIISIVQTPFISNIIAHEKMDAYAYIGIAETILKLIIVMSLVYCTFDRLVFYGCMLMLSSICVCFLYVYYSIKHISDTQYTFYWNSQLIKEFASYSGLSMLVNGADVGSQQCFSIFFNRILGLAANAALGIANQVNSGMLAFTVNMQQSFNPQIVKSYAAGNYDYFFKLIYAATKISFILQLMITVPVVINIDYILNVWLTEYPIITPNLIRVIVIFYLFDAFQNPLIQAVHANGNIKKHQIMISSIKILVIPTFYIVLKITNSPVWAFSTWIIGGIICAICRTIYMKYLVSLDVKKYFTDVVLRIIVLSIVAIIPTFMFATLITNELIRLFFSTFASCMVIIVLSIIWVFNKEERGFLKSIPGIGKIISKIKYEHAKS